MAKGWIKVYRSIWDSEIWDNDEPFNKRDAWIDLLLYVNHEDRNFIKDSKVIEVKRGQCITSIKILATRWHRSCGWVRRYLSVLEQLGMITIFSNARGTTLTVEKYDFYQDNRQADDTADGTTDDTADGTGVGIGGGTHTRSNKNYKNVPKKVRNNNSAADDGADDDADDDEPPVKLSPWGVPWQ